MYIYIYIYIYRDIYIYIYIYIYICLTLSLNFTYQPSAGYIYYDLINTFSAIDIPYLGDPFALNITYSKLK